MPSPPHVSLFFLAPEQASGTMQPSLCPFRWPSNLQLFPDDDRPFSKKLSFVEKFLCLLGYNNFSTGFTCLLSDLVND